MSFGVAKQEEAPAFGRAVGVEIRRPANAWKASIIPRRYYQFAHAGLPGLFYSDPDMKPQTSKPTQIRPIVLMWLGWAIVILLFQAYIRARFDLQRPDYALSWTLSETTATSQDDKPYLLESFLNEHVSWDSEYYLSIAVGGYDDPRMRAIPENYNWSFPQVSLKSERPDWVSMNYAFFPFYTSYIGTNSHFLNV
jgi:hypothetical protein